jgi:3D-(3,5/4)-trihydroxycyclohexane-1,2-dione acylhydrolase (decyclizing)
MNQVTGSPEVHLPGLLGAYARASAIAKAGGLKQALESRAVPSRVTVTLSEALVLGLLRQGVSKYLAIFGHGSTDFGEVLRIYTEAGVTSVFSFRHEVEMSHAATALSWIYGETCAVVTSIGPGALQAMAGSLAAASNGVGVYHIYGDETTHGEGYNMQQIPKRVQHLYGQITAAMGQSYVLHTPEAIRDALRRGTQCVHHPVKAGPFYLLLPLNTQPRLIADCNIEALPERLSVPRTQLADTDVLERAADEISQSEKVVVKVGGGGRAFAAEIRAFAQASLAAVVLSPGSTGVLPDAHAQNMHVGGTKGSISGNYAMSEGELLVVIGSRSVCQADCSGIGYPGVQGVININGDITDVTHYNRTLALCGDIGAVLRQLTPLLETRKANAGKNAWLAACRAKKAEWRSFLDTRQRVAPIYDEKWGCAVLTQPVAIKIVCDYARMLGAIKLFDAGDVQANGFQTVEDDAPFQSFTESGASYMGFAVCALLAGALADQGRFSVAFTGDGSFMMNPQALVSAIEHEVEGLIVIFDNRRMAAISGLQTAQYGKDFRTNDSVAVDYVALSRAVRGVNAIWGGTTRESLTAALEATRAHRGVSVIHVPVYSGPAPEGGLGAYGSWNVGNWCEDVQRRYHSTMI